MHEPTTLEPDTLPGTAEVVDHVPEAARVDEPNLGPLFAQEETSSLRSRWNDIQASFVDEPRKAVQAADALVGDAVRRLSEIFAGERSNLESQWARGDEASTEDLRQAIRRYRAFFDRLLSV